MDSQIEHAMSLIQEGHFSAAYSMLLQLMKAGVDAEFCLARLGFCKYAIAAYEKKGTGMLSGISRRTELLVAREHLEDALKYNTDYYALFVLCGVEYALGLLLNTRNGYAEQYNRHYIALKRKDINATVKFDNQLGLIEELFSA